MISISLASTFVNWKYLKDMNNDYKAREPKSTGNVIKRVVCTQTKIQIVFVPVALISAWIVHQDFELPMWFQYSMCYRIYILTGIRIYVGFTSLVIAAMRYTFVVHQNSILQYGVDQWKTLFYRAGIVIPLVIEILNSCTLPKAGFLAELEVEIPNSICLGSNWESHNITDVKLSLRKRGGSPIYSFVHHYASEEITYYISKCAQLLTLCIMSNVVEGILYWKTFAYIKRYSKRNLFEHYFYLYL